MPGRSTSKNRPSAPFLAVTVYATAPEAHTFDGVTEVLHQLGNRTGLREIARLDEGIAEPVTIGELFQLHRFGPARCEYARRWSPDDRHPIAVLLPAAELGYPIDHLTKHQIAAAAKRRRFARQLLQHLSTLPDILYGTIDIEQPFPTPAAMPSVPLSPDLYLSNDLLLPGTVDAVDSLYESMNGESKTWPNGRFYTLRDPKTTSEIRPLSTTLTEVVARAVTARQHRGEV